MHSEVQTTAVTIISYKPLSDLNFAKQDSMPVMCPLESISPCYNHNDTVLNH